MESSGLALGMACAAGMGLGLMFFGGLWMTVQRIPTASQPALLALGSFGARLLLCLLGFYLVMGGHWERLAVCVVGFIGTRSLLLRRWRPVSPPLARRREA